MTPTNGRGQVEDSVSRRDFLKTSGLALGTLAWSEHAFCNVAHGYSEKSLIHIYLPGGPSHLDTFDMKPGAADSVRGEFHPISTRVPGVQICELLPRLSKLADRLTVVRSVNGLRDEHSPRPSDSGRTAAALTGIGGYPGMAAVLSHLWGPLQFTSAGSVPTCVDLTGWTENGFLGERATIYEPESVARWHRGRRIRWTTKPPYVDGDVPHRGQPLVRRRRPNPTAGLATHAAAVMEDNLTGSAARALTCAVEPNGTLERYGISQCPENARFLTARRLIQAGVRCAAFAWGYWDTHGNNFGQLRRQLPAFDAGLSRLIEDLDAEGRLEATTILISGEFGRTPTINSAAGRDHWPHASFALLAGGGLRHGQVVGATDRLGRQPQDAVSIQRIMATVYQALGINVERTRLADSRGIRHGLLDGAAGLPQVL